MVLEVDFLNVHLEYIMERREREKKFHNIPKKKNAEKIFYYVQVLYIKTYHYLLCAHTALLKGIEWI